MHLPSPRHARPASLVAVLALLAACGGGENTLFTPHGSPAAKVDVKIDKGDKADLVMLVRTPSAPAGERGGTTLDLDAGVFNPQGKELENKHEKHTTWRSSNPDVAVVDDTGFVSALDVGQVMIYVDHKRGTDSISIDVRPVPVASVRVAGPDSLSVNDTEKYTATALDSAGEALVGRAVKWTSGEPTVAALVEPDSLKALSVGMTEVAAAIDEVAGTKTVRVWPARVASVTVTPGEVSVPQFHKVAYSAVAKDRHGNVLTGRPVSWSSSDVMVFKLKANGDSAAGQDLGEAIVTATIEGVDGTSAVTVTNPVEARALWVTRFEYTGPSSVDFAKIATIFQKAASANFNVVYFQVRTSGDALYFSDIEPCSPRMCGTLGGPRPSRDPLDVALTEAAKYGIEVHAWINAYTGFISGSAAACSQYINSTPMNWLRANPSWSVSTKNFTTGVITRQVDNCATSAEYMYVSPGVPEVRTRVAQVSADLARRYGTLRTAPGRLKGIHLDRIRYPSNQVSYDPATQEAFRAATGAYPASNTQASWLNFRRDMVSKGVKEVYDALQMIDPSLVLSAAVFPGYQPRSGWAAAWSFTDYFQDPQAWAKGGYLDVELPMNYPALASSTSWTVKAYCSNTDWTCVLDDHVNRIEKGAGRQVYVGVGAIKGWEETKRQIDMAHQRSVTGVSVYSFSQVDAIPNGWALLKAGPFKHKATIPAMSWKPQN